MNIAASFRNIPPVTRSISFLALLLFLLGLLSLYFPSFVSYLSVTANHSLWFFWTFITAGLFEVNPILFVIHTAALTLSGKYLEQAWGGKEFFRFIMIVNVLSYIGVFLTMVVEYAVDSRDSDADQLIEAHANGLIALMFAFMVAFKQLVPEYSIGIFKVISIRAKHLPSIVLLAYFILFVLGILHTQYYVALYATLTAWIYLRFYKKQDGIAGDRSETFSFASFFPEFLHVIIHPISNSVFNLLVSIHVCAPLMPTYSEIFNGDDLEVGKTMSKPAAKADFNSRLADAERRRALALRALDMRMQSVATESASRGISSPPSPLSARKVNSAGDAPSQNVDSSFDLRNDQETSSTPKSGLLSHMQDH
ncbi:eukaryotic integral membrane protein-domain-containing protein [Polychytrium aggregatum]|uniref:eukaryotic integral membrane protein-domain-containing protein n=1 Tax=Polychytrium aggregatum TaxID=110093 RepID=UPI0022FF3751|nr:eukaryotic integral membrane protein-domain-containing protein [Polychytrium aggregatum]KAI9208489.1 eukaryotic integral membrane protein-domain-containing protein [Polychytrium aggregatum]